MIRSFFSLPGHDLRHHDVVAAIVHSHYHYVLRSGRDRGRRRYAEKEPAFTAYLYLLKA